MESQVIPAVLTKLKSPNIPKRALLEELHGKRKFVISGETTIGSRGKIVVKNPIVSRIHCTVKFINGRWEITDQSKTGTFINGVRVKAREPTVLVSGDIIRLGPESKKIQSFKFDEGYVSSTDVIPESPTTQFSQTVNALKHLSDAFSQKQIKFSDFIIGEMISKGCNAAIYSAGLTDDNNDIKEILTPENFEELHLAIKVMFNYDSDSNESAIWQSNYKEALPAIIDSSRHSVRRKKLMPHLNIVEMYFAFADQFPLLPGAFTNYPQALPERLSSDGCGRNMTLFLVMKRYDINLKEYLKQYSVSTETGVLLFTQLLEGLLYLYENEVAHRDLKTNNIMLDYSYGIYSPRLIITNFGCCLESLQLNYQSPDIEKGGNAALMAPEVVSAEAGPSSVLDYSRADLWAAGTLAYEIFGGVNPFTSDEQLLKNSSYTEDNLPPLPSNAPPAIQKLVQDILKVQPHQRPSQLLAATTCQLIVCRQSGDFTAPPDLSGCHSSAEETSKAVRHWMSNLTTNLHSFQEKTIEQDLKFLFCARFNFKTIKEALMYLTNHKV